MGATTQTREFKTWFETVKGIIAGGDEGPDRFIIFYVFPNY